MKIEIKTRKIHARTKSGVITSAMRFWGAEIGTGGSFEMGLDEKDPVCESLLADLMINKIASVAIYEVEGLMGCVYGGSVVKVEI